jgi:hypothetical protein
VPGSARLAQENGQGLSAPLPAGHHGHGISRRHRACQRDLAAFAAKLTQAQLRAVGSYRKRDGSRDYPKETTFQWVLAKVDAAAIERMTIQWDIQRDGVAAGDDQIAIDGRAQRGNTPHVRDEQKAQLVSA